MLLRDKKHEHQILRLLLCLLKNNYLMVEQDSSRFHSFSPHIASNLSGTPSFELIRKTDVAAQL